MGFSEDFSQAMQGVTQGVNQTVQKRQALEDADKQRAALEVERAEAKRKAEFNQSIEDLERDRIVANTEVAQVEAQKAKGTAESEIDTALISNEALQAEAEVSTQTDIARLQSGAGEQIAESEQSQRDTQKAKNEYIKKEIKAKVAQGVPHAEAVQEASDSWTKVKSNELARDEYQTAIDAAETARLNGIPAQKAVTEKILAVAQRRQAEMSGRRIKLEQEGNFVEEKFEREEADNFMEQARAAIHVANAGNTKDALKLIDLDKDNNGVGDLAEAGAVDMQLVKRKDGSSSLVAIDKNGQVVKDEEGAPVIINDTGVKQYFDDKARQGKIEIPKTAAAAAAAARIKAGMTPKPLKIDEYNKIEDTVDTIIGERWGLGTINPDGSVDNFNLDMGNILPDKDIDGPLYDREITLDEEGRIAKKGKKVVKEPSGEAFFSNTVDQLEIDMKSKLAGAQQTGTLETIAPKYGTLPNAVQAVYGEFVDPVTFRAVLARGAQRAAVDAQLYGQEREGYMDKLMNSFGDKDKYHALPEDIKKFVNAEVLKLAADVQSELAIIAREDDPTIPEETK